MAKRVGESFVVVALAIRSKDLPGLQIEIPWAMTWRAGWGSFEIPAQARPENGAHELVVVIY